MRHTIDIEKICVPISKCDCLQLGQIEIHYVELLEKNGYSQAPVIFEKNGSVWGIIETSYARYLCDHDKQLLIEDENISHLEIGGNPSLDVLFEKMSKAKAVLVVDELDAEEHGTQVFCSGLLTISDLNKLPLRNVLYGVIAEIEEEIAKIIAQSFNDHEIWLKRLKKDKREKIKKNRISYKRGNVDIGPLAGCDLSTLINIVAKSPEIWKQLEYTSRGKFEDDSGCIPDLRHKVMHPVRPLIVEGNIEKIWKTLLTIEDLGNRLSKIKEIKKVDSRYLKG